MRWFGIVILCIMETSIITWPAFAVLMGLATTQAAFTAGAFGINLADAALIPLLMVLWLPPRLASNAI